MILASSPDGDALINIKRNREFQERKWFGVIPVSQNFFIFYYFFLDRRWFVLLSGTWLRKVFRLLWAVECHRKWPKLSGHICALHALSSSKEVSLGWSLGAEQPFQKLQSCSNFSWAPYQNSANAISMGRFSETGNPDGKKGRRWESQLKAAGTYDWILRLQVTGCIWSKSSKRTYVL